MTTVNSDRESFRERMTSVYELGVKDFGWAKGTFDQMQAIR